MATAGLVMGGQPGGAMPVSVLAVPVGGALGDPYVTVLIEVEGESFAAGTQGGVLPAEIYGYAIDSKGSIDDFFTQIIGVDLTKYGDQLRKTGFKFWGELDLEPGDYTVRVLMRNGSTGATSVEVASLAVPDASEQPGDASSAPISRADGQMDHGSRAESNRATERFPIRDGGRDLLPCQPADCCQCSSFDHLPGWCGSSRSGRRSVGSHSRC